ncbi:MAG: restriction system protein [Alphaproteobacteria bacterium]|jgi:restriction system protein
MFENDLIENNGINEKYTSTGRHSGYTIDLYHSGLEEHKHLSAVEQSILLGKIDNQHIAWQKKWEKELQKQDQQSKEENANERTEKAHNKIKIIEELLKHTIYIDDTLDWDTLKHKDRFFFVLKQEKNECFIKYNSCNGYPRYVDFEEQKPIPQKEHFFTNIGWLQRLFKQTDKIRSEQKKQFDNAIIAIKCQNDAISKENIARKEKLIEKQNKWEEEKKKFENIQTEHNAKIEELENLYRKQNSSAILEYCEMVLNNSEYPDNFPQEFDLQYNQVNGMLLIDYHLPSIDEMPIINNVRYVKSRDIIEEKTLSQSVIGKLYDNAIYQIVLRTLHEIFEADSIEAISAINFNGLVTTINPATGHQITSCIVTIQATKTSFEAINLDGIINNTSYKDCFKSLKGIGSVKLSTMTAVKPLLELDKSDKRFRDHYNVADNLNSEMNIASIGWEDFEHLVREIFQKEFTENGGEVKVTQASSDGGVDAIAFDPDPIRGGKIVIQAKRYTNVVGVAAVRELYGTVVNEGATKGILVTTSDYGSDSYNFAKDKPITLLNGSHFLHLLEKHGHKAKIDIKEAKQYFKNLK